MGRYLILIVEANLLMIICYEMFFTFYFSAKLYDRISIIVSFRYWLYELHSLIFHDANSSVMQIYVVDSLDRERIGRAKAEFQVNFLLKDWLICLCLIVKLRLLTWLIYSQAIIRDPFMLNAVILVFANKQDMVHISLNLLTIEFWFWDGNFSVSVQFGLAAAREGERESGGWGVLGDD